MTANDLSGPELAEALLRGASGMDTSEASIRLLLAQGVWPVRLAAADFVELSDEDEPEEPQYAWVGWRYAVAALDGGTLTGAAAATTGYSASPPASPNSASPSTSPTRSRAWTARTSAWCSPPCRTPTAPTSTRTTPSSGPRTAAHLSLPLTPPCSSWDRSSGGRNEGAKRRCACAGSH